MKCSYTISSDRNKSEKTFLFLCIIALVLSAVMGICAGSVKVSLGEFFSAVMSGGESLDSRIILYSRLPRVLAGILAGSALAVSGVIIQSVLENPLAAPSIIGVNSGAGFAAVIAMALLPGNISAVPTASFIGAILTVMLVYLIAVKNGASKITLVLAGVAVSNLMNAGINTVTTFFPDSLGGITSFKIGGVMGMTLEKLNPAWIYILIGLVLALFLSKELDVLALGDKTARSLGMNVRMIRFVLLFNASLLAGAAVSFSGLLSFIGLIIPHIARHFVKSGNTRLIAASALLGGAFVTFCDLISRVIFTPYEIELGIIVSYIGVPFFIYLIMKKRGGRHGDRA